MGEHMPVEVTVNETSLLSLITCTKCHSLMDSPRELDCGHIFCQQCLPIINRTLEKQGLLRQFSVVCLECGKFTHIPGKVVEKLPQAPWVQLLKTFLQSGTSNASGVSKDDTPCSGCKNPRSEMWCQDCDIFLCRTCANSHVLLRKMKEHIILGKSNALAESRNMICQVHGDPMKWLCEDCPKLLCFQCIHQRQCADHNYESISNLVQSKKTRLRNISDHIKTECDKLSDFQKALSLYEEDKTSLFEEYQEKIIDNINQTIERLQTAKSNMLAKIAAKKAEFTINVKEIHDGVNDKLREYEAVKDVIQTVSLPSLQMELVLACPLLEKRVKPQEPTQYRLREQIEDFNLIFKEGELEEPELLVKLQSLSPRRSPRLRAVNLNPCSLYGTHMDSPKEPQEPNGTLAKTIKTGPKRTRRLTPAFFVMVPPPLPERNGLDEMDRTVADSDSSPCVTPSTASDSGVESVSPESLVTRFGLQEDGEPVCNSIVETTNKNDKKRIDPALMPAALPPKPLASENSIFYIDCNVKCRTKTKGYAVVNHSECTHPLPPSDKPITWESISMTDGFEVLCLPNGNICVSFENGVKMYDPDGNLLTNQTVLGAKGMAYRPMKRDILVAGYHSNSIFALHDTSLTFKADLRIAMKKSEKPWSCAALSNGGFVVLYSKDDKYFFLDFYDEDDKFVKSNECGLIAKGPLRMTTDAKDLIFISDESNDQVVICYPNDSYIQTVIVDCPSGMTCTPNERGVFFASNKSICQLKLSPRDGRFSNDRVTDLSVNIKSVANYNNQFICLTDEDVRHVSR